MVAGKQVVYSIFENYFLEVRARATLDIVCRSIAWEIKAPASMSLSRLMPVSMPMPCNMYTTSSVETLPEAPAA